MLCNALHAHARSQSRQHTADSTTTNAQRNVFHFVQPSPFPSLHKRIIDFPIPHFVLLCADFPPYSLQVNLKNEDEAVSVFEMYRYRPYSISIQPNLAIKNRGTMYVLVSLEHKF
jgi:hypothetical protein